MPFFAGSREFLVEWQGYPLDDATWEPEDNLMQETIILFEEKMNLEKKEKCMGEGDDKEGCHSQSSAQGVCQVLLVGSCRYCGESVPALTTVCD